MNKLNASKVEKNDLMKISRWVKVDNKYVDRNVNSPSYGQLVLEISDVDNGHELRIVGQDLIEECLSGDVYNEETTVTKTEIARLLIEAKHVPVTVSFIKANNEERILKGRVIHADSRDLGYVMMEDLELAIGVQEGRLRKVDTRTLNWLILNNTKYLSKK